MVYEGETLPAKPVTQEAQKEKGKEVQPEPKPLDLAEVAAKKKAILKTSLEAVAKAETDPSKQPAATAKMNEILENFDKEIDGIQKTHADALKANEGKELPADINKKIDDFILGRVEVPQATKDAIQKELTEAAKGNQTAENVAGKANEVLEGKTGLSGMLKNLLAVWKVIKDAMKTGDMNLLDSVMDGFNQGKEPFAIIREQKEKVTEKIKDGSLVELMNVYSRTLQSKQVEGLIKENPKLSTSVVKSAAEDLIQGQLGGATIMSINGRVMNLSYEDKIYSVKVVTQADEKLTFQMDNGKQTKDVPNVAIGTADGKGQEFASLVSAMQSTDGWEKKPEAPAATPAAAPEKPAATVAANTNTDKKGKK